MNFETKSGTEGPRHDPYSYEEFIVAVQPDYRVTFHIGFSTWVEEFSKNAPVETVRHEFLGIMDSNAILRAAEAKFEELVGYSIQQCARFKDRLKKSRQCLCSKKHWEWVDGYPGESLLLCRQCGHVNDYSFNMSAIA